MGHPAARPATLSSRVLRSPDARSGSARPCQKLRPQSLPRVPFHRRREDQGDGIRQKPTSALSSKTLLRCPRRQEDLRELSFYSPVLCTPSDAMQFRHATQELPFGEPLNVRSAWEVRARAAICPCYCPLIGVLRSCPLLQSVGSSSCRGDGSYLCAAMRGLIDVSSRATFSG